MFELEWVLEHGEWKLYLKNVRQIQLVAQIDYIKNSLYTKL